MIHFALFSFQGTTWFSTAASSKRLVYYILSLSECQAVFEFLFKFFSLPIKASKPKNFVSLLALSVSDLYYDTRSWSICQHSFQKKF